MTTQHDTAKRWRQFSLRALLLLMLVVASYLGGWMSNEWKRQRELERAQQDAEAEMLEAEAQMEMMTKAMMSVASPSLPPGTEPPASE